MRKLISKQFWNVIDNVYRVFSVSDSGSHDGKYFGLGRDWISSHWARGPKKEPELFSNPYPSLDFVLTALMTHTKKVFKVFFTCFQNMPDSCLTESLKGRAPFSEDCLYRCLLSSHDQENCLWDSWVRLWYKTHHVKEPMHSSWFPWSCCLGHSASVAPIGLKTTIKKL